MASQVNSSEEAVECCLDEVMGNGEVRKKECSSLRTKQKEVVDELEPEEVTMDYQDFSVRTQSSCGKVGLLVMFFVIEQLRGSPKRCSALVENPILKVIAPLMPFLTSCVLKMYNSARALLKLVTGKKQSLCYPLISELYIHFVSILLFRTGIG